MWCNERSRLQAVTGLSAVARKGAFFAGLGVALCVSAWVGAGSAAAQTSAPTLKVSGKSSFVTEARALGDSYEVRATLVDEVGRPLPGCEIRIRTLSASSAATLHRCGDP